tara:strand:+ start:1212 stop:2810 length:1599 start_codon:yes stop_codon:yes gene_type:complete
MNLYEGFNVGGDNLPISISKGLSLTYDKGCKPAPEPPPPPPPTPSGNKPSASEVFPSIVPITYPDGGYWIIHNDYINPVIIWFDMPVVDSNPKSITYADWIHIFKTPDINLNNSNVWETNYNTNVSLENTDTREKYTKTDFLKRLKISKRPPPPVPLPDPPLPDPPNGEILLENIQNGILLNPKDKLSINLKGEDTQIISMGFWMTHQFISSCGASPDGASRFEITMTYPCTKDEVDKKICNKNNGKVNQLYFNQSYVDGFNSNVDVYVNLGDSCNIILHDNYNKCRFPLDNSCDNIGGKSFINNNISVPIDNKNGQKVCLSPKHSMFATDDPKFESNDDIFNTSRLGSSSNPGNPHVIQKLISVNDYDPVGCNTNAEKNIYSKENNKIFTGMCSCLNAWYSQPSSINPKLNEWAKTVHNNCPSSYFFSYGEQIPNDFDNIENNDIFKNQDWCYKIFKEQNKLNNLNKWETTSSVLAEYIPSGKDTPLFSKDSESLPACGVPSQTYVNNYDPKVYDPFTIIINITDIYDHEE